ncbi:hypothetical protein D3C77_541120 [compost metagenome]
MAKVQFLQRDCRQGLQLLGIKGRAIGTQAQGAQSVELAQRADGFHGQRGHLVAGEAEPAQGPQGLQRVEHTGIDADLIALKAEQAQLGPGAERSGNFSQTVVIQIQLPEFRERREEMLRHCRQLHSMQKQPGDMAESRFNDR